VREWAWRICVTFSVVLMAVTAALWARAQRVQDVARRVWVERQGGQGTVRQVEACAFRNVLAVAWASQGLRTDLPPAHVNAVIPPLPDAHARRQTAVPASLEPITDGWWFGGFACGRLERSLVPPDNRFLLSDGTHAGLADTRSAWVIVPWWFLTLLFALTPARAVWTWRRSRRRPPHTCPGCGYDLRATADPAGPRLSTCPECGRSTTSATRA
jgi:hypothetical protein